MKVLVTGGAGYIGSITAQELVKKGHQVVIYDSLENGHRQAVKDLELVIGETQDVKFLINLIRDKKIQAVIHFAAYIEMAESYKNPYKYFYNNVYGSLQLFKAMVKNKVTRLVFSSTAGVYGHPVKLPIKEEDPKNPENPYGESKLMVENILKWFAKAYDLQSICLRYFNAAGATLKGKLGEDHDPESHLIPNVIKTALGLEKEVILYGDNYKTPDGTCIRDYIHVSDLASAHILALEALEKDSQSNIFNIGTGKGYSNKEVIEMVKKVTGKDFKVKVSSPRPGDTDQLVADPSKIKKEFNWQPKHSDLETIIKTAYQWHKSQPKGYKDG